MTVSRTLSQYGQPCGDLTTALTSGLTVPHQLALDEDHNQAYVVEFSNGGGRLLRVDLTTGGTQTIYDGLDSAVLLRVVGLFRPYSYKMLHRITV